MLIIQSGQPKRKRGKRKASKRAAKRGKLTGKAKAEFLARMARGRKKAKG